MEKRGSRCDVGFVFGSLYYKTNWAWHGESVGVKGLVVEEEVWSNYSEPVHAQRWRLCFKECKGCLEVTRSFRNRYVFAEIWHMVPLITVKLFDAIFATRVAQQALTHTLPLLWCSFRNLVCVMVSYCFLGVLCGCKVEQICDLWKFVHADVYVDLWQTVAGIRIDSVLGDVAE